METIKPVELVTISKLIPIFKNGESANAIEVAHVIREDGNELQYDIVVQKGLYEIGDSVVYIQPDYCLPQTSIFSEYHFPGGEASRCRLGKKGRIRAIKFNLNFKGSTEPIYSFGIILPHQLVIDWLLKELSPEAVLDVNSGRVSLMDALKITKYEADDSFEKQSKGIIDGQFPGHILYKTDEPTIQNCKNAIDMAFENKEVVSFTIKKDGSSITLYYFDEDEMGICSRKMKKKMDQTYIQAYQDGDITLHRYWNKDYNDSGGCLGWKNDVTAEFFTESQAKEKFAAITAVYKDSWVDTVKKHGYERCFDYCRDNKIQLAFRGELVGAGNKGSGNKLNSDAKTGESDIYWFGIDDLSSGHAHRNHYGTEYNLEKVSHDLNLKFAEPVLEGVYDYDGIINACNEIFRQIKEETGQVIEGIVIRTKFSNNISVKYINPEYDAKS